MTESYPRTYWKKRGFSFGAKLFLFGLLLLTLGLGASIILILTGGGI